ncbi:MAG: signal peptidase II [Lachnospiraceae bacterium]
MNRKAAGAVLSLGIAAGTLVGDQLVKKRARDRWKGKEIRIDRHGHRIPEGSDARAVCTLRFCENSGMAMNALAKHPEVVKFLDAGMTGAVAGALAEAFASSAHPLRKTGLSLVLGGALSNLTDRIRDGYVTDYVNFEVGPEHFRQIVFNIGDFAILAGALICTGTADSEE